MSVLDLRSIARALGGEVSGRQVLAPGPGHSPRDRSLSVRLSWQAPDGFIVFSHAGDDFASCRDHVRAKLGLSHVAPTRRDAPVAPAPSDHAARIARAVAIWNEASDAHGTVVETYLAGRGLELPPGAGALRYHARTPWRNDDGSVIFVPCMVAAMRTIDGDVLTAVHRTRLTPDGVKLGRRMLGIAAGAAVKLDADVTHGLAIGEGIETVLAARQLGFRPAWALASAGAIAGFPVLPGIECLTILAENDDANARAVEECARRWHAANREVTVVSPNFGSDLNDAIRGAA